MVGPIVHSENLDQIRTVQVEILMPSAVSKDGDFENFAILEDGMEYPENYLETIVDRVRYHVKALEPSSLNFVFGHEGYRFLDAHAKLESCECLGAPATFDSVHVLRLGTIAFRGDI
jgi:hypothetical protein